MKAKKLFVGLVAMLLALSACNNGNSSSSPKDSSGAPDSSSIPADSSSSSGDAVIAVESISLSAATLALEEEETGTLTATVLPANASNKTVTWVSDHPEIASVDNGVVTAVAVGSATITARAGDKSATCVVTVSAKIIAVSSVRVAPVELALVVGDESNLTATVLPDNATDKTVSWSSSDDSIATVDNNGKVTAVAVGNAVITATAGNQSDTCAVAVAERVVPVESVTLDQKAVTLKDGGREADGQVQLTATILPEDASVKTVSWSSSDEDVATVSRNGLVISGTKTGTATITATAGDKSDTCVITVEITPVTAVDIYEEVGGQAVALESKDLDVTDKYTIKAQAGPKVATDKSLEYESSDPNIASVSDKGVVEAKKNGTATITVKSHSNPDVNDTLTINVKTKINRNSITIAVGENFQLTANSGSDATASWSSSDSTVASVDANGLVTAVKGGNAKITVTKDGSSKDIDVVVLGSVNYTYNDYTTISPSNWNELTYQDNNDTQILSYIVGGLFTFNYKFDEGHYGESDHIVDGGFSIEYDGATKLEDVTSSYVNDSKYDIPEGADSGYAYKITLRQDLKWEDGTPIDGRDFIYSMQEQLNPEFQNFRADSYYAGTLVINDAKNYLNSGLSVYEAATSAFEEYDASLDDKLTFAFGSAQHEKTSYFYDYVSEDYENYVAANGMVWLVNAFGWGFPYTQAQVDSLDGKTIAEIKADSALKPILDGIIEWWDEGDDGYLHLCIGEKSYPEVSWDEVGFKLGDNNYELILVLDKPLNLLEANGDLGFHAAYELSSLPLVKHDLYESCKKEPQAGATLKTTNYNSSVETSASWGPYKLTYFQAGKQYVLDKNPNWYGWNMDAYANQYKTDRIICDTIPSWNTAWLSFQQGDIATIGMDVSIADEYKGSKRALFTGSDFVGSMQIQSLPKALKDREEEGYDKEMLLYADFRKAISLAIDRDEYTAKTTTASKAGYGIFNSMHYYDVEHGGVYRNEDVAKRVLCEVYGIKEDDYASLDEAYAALKGYDLDQARELVRSAYAEALAAGTISETDIVKLTFGTSEISEPAQRQFDTLTGYLVEMVKETPLEGRLETELKVFGTKWANDFRAGAYDICTGGWSGAAWDPGWFLVAYLADQYRYAQGWDPKKVSFTYNPYGDELDEHTYNMTIQEWYDCLNGNAGCKYNWAEGKVENSFRLGIIAQIERQILLTYYVVPMQYAFSAQLDSYKLHRFSTKYNTFMGYGGIRYLSYDYTDAAWNGVKDNFDYKA